MRRRHYSGVVRRRRCGSVAGEVLPTFGAVSAEGARRGAGQPGGGGGGGAQCRQAPLRFGGDARLTPPGSTIGRVVGPHSSVPVEEQAYLGMSSSRACAYSEYSGGSVLGAAAHTASILGP